MTSPVVRRVLQVHTRYRQAGGEDRAVEAERVLLESAGIDVGQVIFDNADLEEGRSVGGSLGVAAAAVWSSDAARRVNAAIAEHRPDIVHVHNTFAAASPSVFRAASAAGVAVVHTLHNYRLICPVATMFRDGRVCDDCTHTLLPVPAVVHACVRGSHSQSIVAATTAVIHRVAGTYSGSVDAYIALTAFQARTLGTALPTRRIHVVPNFLEPDPGPGGTDRAGILFVGRLSPEKGVQSLLAAAAIEPHSITVAGDGPLRHDVELAHARGEVRYLGPLDQISTLDHMRRAVAVAVPSTWYEGFPMVVLEAFASGTPVVVSDIGSLSEIVEDGGTGLVVPPGDAPALARAFATVIEAPSQSAAMGRSARLRYEVRYRGSGHLALLRQVYGRAMDRRAGARAAS